MRVHSVATRNAHYKKRRSPQMASPTTDALTLPLRFRSQRAAFNAATPKRFAFKHAHRKLIRKMTGAETSFDLLESKFAEHGVMSRRRAKNPLFRKRSWSRRLDILYLNLRASRLGDSPFRAESPAASPRRLGLLEEVFAVPFRTVDLPDGLAERPICPDCEGMMRLVWIAADKQHQDRHTYGAPLVRVK